MQITEAGGRSIDRNSRLSTIRPCFRTFPEIPFRGNFVNNSPSIIPAIENDQQRVALALFREARASNNDYLTFLFFWHVLEVGGEIGESVVDRILASGRCRLVRDDLAKLSPGNRTVGEHLREDIRNAVAHIRRHRGRRALDFYSLAQRNEMKYAARVTHRIAESFMETELGIGQRRLYLLRRGRNGFPTYSDLQNMDNPEAFREAYPRK